MKKLFNKIDKPLLVLTIILLALGLLMLGSASSLKAYVKIGDSFYYLKKQLLFAVIGIIATIIILKIPIKNYKRLIWLGVAVIIGALLYVLLKGEVNKGIKGWINIGSFGIQPSEFAKTAIILFLAIIYEKLLKLKQIGNVGPLIPMLVPGFIFILVFMQPDLGTAVIIGLITFIIFLVLPIDKKYYKLMVCSSLIVMVVFIAILGYKTDHFLTDVQKARLNFKEPCTRYREETGYQVCNGYIAINSGGLTGVGVGDSKQKYLYLPEAHTDFIYAIVIEELGLIVGIAILLAFFILIYRIMKIAKRSYNLQGSIICYGVATYISSHILINLCGVFGLLPMTGIPFPFFSYGGSFLINLLINLALVQRVAIENKIFEQAHIVK